MANVLAFNIFVPNNLPRMYKASPSVTNLTLPGLE
jgi:hypothetical protein